MSVQAGVRTPMSYASYLAMGESRHHEYYDGAVWVNPPTRRHVEIERALVELLSAAAPPAYEVLSGWGWHVGPGEDYEPDVMVFRRDAPAEDVLREAPLMVVEVVSPSTRQVDYGRKVEAYARRGAGWYWVVDPATHEVTVRWLDGNATSEQHFGSGRHQVVEPFPVLLDVDRLFV